MAKGCVFMLEVFGYGFMQRAFVAIILIAIAAGLVGPFLVLRRLSLIGEGLAHLAFAGVAIGFLLGTPPILTALVVILLGSLVVRRLVEKNTYGEAAIALVLSFGVGTGIVIIGATQGFGTDLFSYLIGSVLALTWSNILLLGVLTVVTAGFIWYFKRELFLLTFQKDVAQLASKKTGVADYLFSLLIAVVVLMAIQAVGILLVTALLVIPSLIALQIARSFNQTLLYTSVISAAFGILGIVLSFYLDLPPSGLIVLLLLTGYVLVAAWKKYL